MTLKALHDPTLASLLFCPLHPTLSSLGSSLHPLFSDTRTHLKPFIDTRRWFSPALSLSLNAFSYSFIGNNNDPKLQDLNVSQPLITVENRKVFWLQILLIKGKKIVWEVWFKKNSLSRGGGGALRVFDSLFYDLSQLQNNVCSPENF